jgi:hypothetical protein
MLIFVFMKSPMKLTKKHQVPSFRYTFGLPCGAPKYYQT